MNCPYCNAPLPDGAVKCPGCGSPAPQTPPQGQYAPPPQGQYAPPPAPVNAKPKSRILYQVLALFLGQLGIHNFYAGRTVIACIQLAITIIGNIIAIAVLDASGGVGPVIIWAIIEIFAVKKDGRGIPMK